MSLATPTAADLALGAGNPYLAGLITAIAGQTPIFNSFPMFELNGTFIYALALAALPTPTGFIDLNEGMVSTKAQLVVGKIEAKRIGVLIEAAKSSTDLWNEANPGRNWIDIQVKARLLSEIQNLEKTIFLGTANDAKAFYGLKEITSPVTANTYALTDSPVFPLTKSLLNVGGTTANTASSVYSVCHGEEDAALYMGGPQGVSGFLNMSEIIEQIQFDPGSTTKKQRYYLTDGEGMTVLSLMGSSEAYASKKFPQFSVRRACNLTAETGKGCTEAVMDFLMDAHPMGHKPTAFYMSLRSQKQLRADRIANGTVQLQPGLTGDRTVRADLPTSHRGIPIIICEQAILDTQAIESIV